MALTLTTSASALFDQIPSLATSGSEPSSAELLMLRSSPLGALYPVTAGLVGSPMFPFVPISTAALNRPIALGDLQMDYVTLLLLQQYRLNATAAAAQPLNLSTKQFVPPPSLATLANPASYLASFTGLPCKQEPSDTSATPSDCSIDDSKLSSDAHDPLSHNSISKNKLGRSYNPGRPLAMAERQRILDLYEKGHKISHIARIIGVTHSCVSKIMSRYRRTGSMHPRSAQLLKKAGSPLQGTLSPSSQLESPFAAAQSAGPLTPLATLDTLAQSPFSRIIHGSSLIEIPPSLVIHKPVPVKSHP